MGNYQSIQPMAVLATAVAIGLCATDAGGTDAHIARYSEISLHPSDAQRDPLLSQVQSRVPDELTQVGEAVDWLLEPSGYRRATATNASPDLAWLWAFPLPEVHRSLEGLPVRTALQTLAGPAYLLVEDPVHRLVSFQSCRDAGEAY
ncbi:MAG: pili assembly chaperone [Pseudomonadota bacterium]